jgi:hypothetical protein
MKTILASLSAVLVVGSTTLLLAEPPAGGYQVQFVVSQRPWTDDAKEVATRMLSDDEVAAEAKPTSADVDVISRPTSLTIEGAEAYFQLGGRSHSYIVGYVDGVPQHEGEYEGLTLCYVPHTVDDRHVRLELNYQSARVAGMRRLAVRGAMGDEPGVIETPLVQRTRLDIDVDAEVGKYVLVEGIADRNHDGDLCEVRVLIRVERK